MLAVKKIGKNCIFVSFPTNIYGDLLVPNDIKEWIEENKPSYMYGFVNDKPNGIFLSDEDAILFKLKFNVYEL